MTEHATHSIASPTAADLLSGAVPLLGAVPQLGVIEDGRWVPGIEDATAGGWLTVGAYLLASALCLLWALVPGRGRLMPVLIAVGMLLLAAFKQFDLQGWFTVEVVRTLQAIEMEDDRRVLAAAFRGAIVVAGIVMVASLLWCGRERFREAGVALVGASLLLVVLLIRAASLGRVDPALGGSLWAARLDWVLELGAICIVGAGAAIGWRHRQAFETGPLGRSRPAARSKPPLVVPAAASPRPLVSVGRVEVASDATRFVVRPIRISEGPRRGNGAMADSTPAAGSSGGDDDRGAVAGSSPRP
jgi:hypothetical protein